VPRLIVNGVERTVQDQPDATLLDVLRDELGLTGTKYGCGEGECGACTVLLDGEPVNSCLVFAVQVDGADVTTVRGLSADGEELHPLQAGFLAHSAAQCGFCTPGMLLTATWYLEHDPDASRAELREAISGNLCRCTGYTKILDALEEYRDARAEARGGD
jgi:aerobic carbon-monoxide dehydrogenase small subunit